MDDGPRPTPSAQPALMDDVELPQVSCADEQDDVEVDVARWEALALDVLVAQGVRPPAELSITFVDETEMSSLNAEHMGVDGPTDVLAFPIDVADTGLGDTGPGNTGLGDVPRLLGDVVICPAVADRQAPEHAGTLDDELALLVVHGVLHVLGHDHAGADEAMAMRIIERTLLEQLHWHGPAPTAFRQEHAEPAGESVHPGDSVHPGETGNS